MSTVKTTRARDTRLSQSKISYKEFQSRQLQLVTQPLPQERQKFINAFINWYNEKNPERMFYQQYQPQCISTILNQSIKQAYYEIGCGGGKTTIFCFAAVLIMFLDRSDCILTAPILNLLSQTRSEFNGAVTEFNKFLADQKKPLLRLQFFNVSSDEPMTASDEDDEDAQARQALSDIPTLGNSDAIRDNLEERDESTTRNVYLVCSKSLPKMISALNKSTNHNKLFTIIDEFHMEQTSNASRAEIYKGFLDVLLTHCESGVHAFSATPKTSIPNSGCTFLLSIESGNWGRNGVAAAVKRVHCDAAYLREQGILKANIEFAWNLKVKGTSVSPEFQELAADRFGVNDAEECLDSVGMILAFCRAMPKKSVGIMFLSSVSHIKLFMSKDASKWRKQIEEEYGVRFYATHAGVSREERDSITRDIYNSRHENKDVKHIILNHSTWLIGMNCPPISWVYIARRLQSHNLVQAISRGTRKSAGTDTCTVVFPDSPDSVESLSMVRDIYDAYGPEVRHFMFQDEERVASASDSVPERILNSDTSEIQLSGSHFVVEHYFEEQVAEARERKQIAEALMRSRDERRELFLASF